MSWFKRRPKEGDGLDRDTCPICNEPVPEGAVDCKMCGSVLRLRTKSGTESQLRPASAGRHSG